MQLSQRMSRMERASDLKKYYWGEFSQFNFSIRPLGTDFVISKKSKSLGKLRIRKFSANRAQLWVHVL